MAPLTLSEKYNDLIRCADQPLTSYERLTNEDFEDVISKKWPFIIHSITYQPVDLENDESNVRKISLTSEVRTRLERRLKIHFPLYSEVAKRHQQKFPSRKPVRRTHVTNTINPETESLSMETTSTFFLEGKTNKTIPDFYVFSSTKHCKPILKNFICVKKYLMASVETSPYKTLVFKQAIQECCRCGYYSLLNSLYSAMNIPIENIYFDNHDSILHRCIQLNNQQLTSELIRHGFNIDLDGELGTPLVTAIHYDILWAVELLLNHGADLTKRHIDYPLLTLYEYSIELNKIDIKLIIDRYLALLIRKNNNIILRKLINNGWTISLKKRRYYHHS